VLTKTEVWSDIKAKTCFPSRGVELIECNNVKLGILFEGSSQPQVDEWVQIMLRGVLKFFQTCLVIEIFTIELGSCDIDHSTASLFFQKCCRVV
jgi:hypothetical protein